MLDEVLLYDVRDSPFCVKARICLHLKSVPFRSVTVTLRRARELRRLNPLGKVPVLVQGPEVVADSSRIARHLEARYPDPGLIPADPAARAYAALLEEWADEALYFIVGAFKWLNPENRAAAVDNTVSEISAGALRPLVGRALAWSIRRRYAAWGCRSSGLGELVTRMRENLATLETLLSGKPYLLGRVTTLADVAVFSQLAWMRGYAEARLIDEVPAVAEWLDRLQAAPPIAAALRS
jgi:glutathione S-transferase